MTDEMVRVLTHLSARVGRLEALLKMFNALGPYEVPPKALRAALSEALAESAADETSDQASDRARDHSRAYRIGG